MKIALINEISQSDKNAQILAVLQEEAGKHGHTVYNVGMTCSTEPELSYIHLGIMASLLLGSGAVDFVVTGCGTGQGAMISLNSYPDVVCGLVVDPTDALLFGQINNGNAVSLPFAKGFGWAAEMNLHYVFEKLFSTPFGGGYPEARRVPQQAYVKILHKVKHSLGKTLKEQIAALDPQLVREACANERFRSCFFENSKDEELCTLIRSLEA